MRDLAKIQGVFHKYGGMMRTYQLSQEKIYYADIAFLLNEGAIEKVRTGYYQWVDHENLSEVATVVRLFPDGILCMDTALRHYGYSDRTPVDWHIAVNKYSNRSNRLSICEALFRRAGTSRAWPLRAEHRWERG